MLDTPDDESLEYLLAEIYVLNEFKEFCRIHKMWIDVRVEEVQFKLVGRVDDDGHASTLSLTLGHPGSLTNLFLITQSNPLLHNALNMPRVKQIASSNTRPQKRPLSPAKGSASRQSKRIRSSPVPSATPKTTPKKSQFFYHESSTSDIESEINNEESGYEDEDASISAVSTPPESDVEDDQDEEDGYASEEARPKKRKAGGKNGSTVAAVTPKAAKGQELWRPGVKTDLAPGEAVFIKLPKAREAGKTPYKDGTIHPNTMLFLRDLKDNNDREWLKGGSLLFYIPVRQL